MPLLLNEPGHGSNTWPPSKGINASGGVPGMAEHSFNAAVADEVNRILAGEIPTYSAQPSNGRDVPLATRIARYNEKYRLHRDAIGMSHHGNAGGSSTRGFGVFYWHASAAGKKLAQLVLDEYKKEFPDMPIWGDGLFPCVPNTWTNFYLVRETMAPFVLIEWEFFTNNAARDLMLTSNYRERCGKVAARAAGRWYGVSIEDTPNVKPAADIKKKDYLEYGDRGPEVGALQKYLNQVGYPVDIHSYYNAETRKAVMDFQEDRGLLPDGVYGKASKDEMNKALKELKEEPTMAERIFEAATASLAKEWKEAHGLGITDGANPDGPLTRAQGAAIIVRALKNDDIINQIAEKVAEKLK